MAIGAEKDAFRRFSARRIDADSVALVRDGEALAVGVEVMELESADASVITASATGTTGLLDEDALDLPATLSDSVLSAPPATPPAAFVEHELDVSVVAASPSSSSITRAEPLSPIPRPNLLRLRKLVFVYPVANGVDRDLKSLSDLTEAQALAD